MKSDDTSLPNDIAHRVQFYEAYLLHPVMLETEFNTWKTNWRHNEEDLPNNLIDALKSCSFLQFPNLHTF